jgi:hypothetical protein
MLWGFHDECHKIFVIWILGENQTDSRNAQRAHCNGLDMACQKELSKEVHMHHLEDWTKLNKEERFKFSRAMLLILCCEKGIIFKITLIFSQSRAINTAQGYTVLSSCELVAERSQTAFSLLNLAFSAWFNSSSVDLSCWSRWCSSHVGYKPLIS